jgi:hypothetical protein
MSPYCCFSVDNVMQLNTRNKNNTTVNYLRTFLTNSSHNNNNNSIDRRMISVSSWSHYLDMYIYIYVCMRHNTLSLTSLRRLLFYRNDFDNHLFPSLSLYLLSTGKYICVTGRTQQSLMTRTPSSAKGSSLCSRLLSDGKKKEWDSCACAQRRLANIIQVPPHPTLFPSSSSFFFLSSKLENTAINCN